MPDLTRHSGVYEHSLRFALDNGVELEVLVFKMAEMTFLYQHRFCRDGEDGKVDLVNQLRVVAAYKDGFLSAPLTLSMHIILPQRLGQVYAWGADISPGAKTYIEFQYVPQQQGQIKGPWRLDEIQVGARKRIRLDQGPGLMRPVEFPFPVPDILTPQFGHLSLPFLRDPPEVLDTIEIPLSTLRYQKG